MEIAAGYCRLMCFLFVSVYVCVCLLFHMYTLAVSFFVIARLRMSVWYNFNLFHWTFFHFVCYYDALIPPDGYEFKRFPCTDVREIEKSVARILLFADLSRFNVLTGSGGYCIVFSYI